MARFYGKVGFVSTQLVDTGVWEEVPVERYYRGDFTQDYRKWESGDSRLNDTLTMSNIVRIVADAYAYENMGNMRYVYLAGSAWKIASIEIDRPRLRLTLGGLYEGTTLEAS